MKKLVYSKDCSDTAFFIDNFIKIQIVLCKFESCLRILH